MKEHPILFTGAMVRAILEGRKTQTRRPIKVRKDCTLGIYKQGNGLPDLEIVAIDPGEATPVYCNIYAPFRVGDRLWVRETWGLCAYGDPTDFYHLGVVNEAKGNGLLDRYGFEYRADWGSNQEACFWRPSIHMPRWASRITLEVTGIRPERVKSIPQSDAIAEGVEYRPAKGMSPGGSGTFHVGAHFASTAKGAFACLWDSIYGDGPHADDGPLAWANNPWTWATTFKVVTP